MPLRWLVGAVAVGLATGPAVARADDEILEALEGVCADEVRDPVDLGLLATNVDAPRGACPRTTVTLRPLGRALIATDDFYGTVGGGLIVDLRVASGVVEWGVGARIADLTFVQNAVITVTELRYGPVTGHAAWLHRGRLGGRVLRLAAVARVDVPLTTSSAGANAGAIQLAEVATLGLGDAGALHGRLGVLGWYGFSVGGTTTRAAAVASLDASHQVVWPWLIGQLGAEIQGGWYGAGLDHVAVRAAFHWRVIPHHRMDVGAVVPLLGDDRTDAVVTLGYHHDL